MPEWIGEGIGEGLDFLPHEYSDLYFQILKNFMPKLWLYPSIKTKDIRISGMDILANSFKDFFDNKIRLIIAYRHYTNDDPPCLFYAYGHKLPKYLKKNKIKLPNNTNCYFLYYRGLPIWIGDAIAKLARKMGGISTRRGIPDIESIKNIRELMINGEFPLLIAPEGGINFHSGIISQLEYGVSQIALWACDDLEKQNKNTGVNILPVNLYYEYHEENLPEIDSILDNMEKELGIETKEKNDRLKRLIAIKVKVYNLLESYYKKYYRINFDNVILTEENYYEIYDKKIKFLIDSLLSIDEKFLGIDKKDNSNITRCRVIEDRLYEYIYRKDIKDIKSLSKVEKGLADHLAEETRLKFMHLRISEILLEETSNYLKEKFNITRLAEEVLNFYEILTRMKITNKFERPVLKNRTVWIDFGKPINAKDYFSIYKSNKKEGLEKLNEQILLSFKELAGQRI